jgi:hypothetical protein
MARTCIVVATDGSKSVWKQLPFGQTAGRNEAWLRDLLQAHPELVPLDELDPTYGPLVPLCTELPTPAGRIDNVFINPQGRLTLVECKLWNNVEARRKVVAQILDYAKELGRWSATDLAARVASRRGLDTKELFGVVQASHTGLQEREFHDGVVRSLREGRFQLLVAGDGIREEVRGIADLINKNATSAFSFGLFQIELYEGPEGALMVQPRAISRTQLIERTVIIVQHEGTPHLESVDSPADSNDLPGSSASGAQKAHASSAEWWKPVLDSALQNRDQEPFRYYWPHNIRGSLPWPGTWITAYRSSAGAQPTVGVFLGGREHPLVELLRALEPDWDDLRETLPEGTVFDPGQKLQVSRPLGSFSNEDDARSWLIETVNKFVNEIRPRAAALAGR